MKNKNILKYSFFLFTVAVVFVCVSFIYPIYKENKITINKNYPIALSDIKNKEEILHFPAKIPEGAKNIKVYEYSDMPYNGEILLLNFEIDENYIDNELKKNKFINKDKLGEVQKIYYVPKVSSDFKINEYTYFVLDTKDNRSFYPKYFPYFTGIGIKNNKSAILYYYIFPAD